MFLGTDNPRMVDPAQIRDAAARGRSYVTGGLYITATGPQGERPGEEALVAGPTAAVLVEVQAASWVRGDRLEVIVDAGATASSRI
jgi:hypothetical protein